MRILIDRARFRTLGWIYVAWCFWAVVMALVRFDLDPNPAQIVTVMLLPIPIVILIAALHFLSAACKLAWAVAKAQLWGASNGDANPHHSGSRRIPRD